MFEEGDALLVSLALRVIELQALTSIGDE